ncbi:MAG TPA: choice-of-anchor L domain-containing protein, partial [Euzebya sp.]|nr:choice-of-anchor L domain-containing protein [Euzebya sp.]
AQVDVTVQLPVNPRDGAVATAADGVVIEPVGEGPAAGPVPIDPSRNRPAIITSTPFSGFTDPADSSGAAFARRLVDRHWRTTFDVDLGEEAGLPIPLELTGTLEAFFYVDVALDIDIEWCWGVVPCGAEVEHFKVELGGGERLEAIYDLGGTQGGGDIEVDPIELGSIELGSLTFTIGPVPVVVSATMDFEIGIDGTLQGAISGRATQSLTLATGVEYRDDDWHDLSRVDWEHDFSRVTDTGSVRAQIRPFVGVDLSLRIYGVRGPYVRGEPYLLADVETGRNPLFNLYLGFRAAAGIEVDALGIDYEAELLNVRTLVATSANYPPASPPSVVIVGPDGLPPVLSPGFAQVQTFGPRQVFCCDVLLDYSADLSGAPEGPDALYVRWSARNVTTGDSRVLGQAAPDVARLTLPPGTWDITGQAATRTGDNLRGVADVVRVQILAQTEIAVTPVGGDDAGALTLAQAATATAASDLVTDARFESLPSSNPAAHGTAGPGPCGPGTPATRVCPRGIPGLGSGAVLTTGTASAVTTERNPAAPASPDSQEAVTDGVRGTSDTDVTVLAIDVDVPETATCLRFTYRYASEELPDYVGSRFNDAFVAELDTTTWTTQDSQLVAPDDFARTDAGRQVTTNGLFGGGVDALNAAHTTYEQGTRLLQAATPVTPGAHTLYLSLMDQGDASFDSAVFIGGLEAVNAPASACTSGLAPGPSGPFLG